MGKYSQYISDQRREIATPVSLVDDGKAAFGTFDKEFENLNLLDAKKPTHLASCFNKIKLTRWEALEVHLDEGELVVGLCNMGIMATLATIFFDTRNCKLYSWSNTIPVKKAVIASNLLNGHTTYTDHKNAMIKYINDFQEGKAEVNGAIKNKKAGEISFDFFLVRASKPSIVSIPFGPNRPLYTQKDLFKAEGSLTLNGETFKCNDNTYGVIDDHRGYYPRHAHYDWLTTMGRGQDGNCFGFNLTRNQSIDQDKFNENLIWLKNDSSLLPPIVFKKSAPTNTFVSEKETPIVWTIKDEHEMVNLSFRLTGVNKMIVHAGIIRIDYFVTFGILSGYLMQEDGKKIILDGMQGIGEDKTLLF